MNFLAHTLFAQGDSDRIVGQFCGDFVRGSDLSEFPPGIQLGIRRHRRIDAFTDRHPAVRASLTVFEPPVRRFAGIVADVVFDHYLARDWDSYSDMPLHEHVEHVHSALNENRHTLPPTLQRFATFLQRENVLLGNLDYSGVELTLQRLAARSERFSPIADGADIARREETTLLNAFNTFFPELLALERARSGQD